MLGTTYERSGQTKQMVSLQEGEINLKYYDITHVSRAWSEIFISRASLWTDFYCIDAEKTRVCLERSKSAPINVWLEREQGLFPNDPFLDIPSHAIGRLKSLCLTTTPDHFDDITKHLVHPAPRLNTLVIDGGVVPAHESISVLTSTLFAGDLSSLRGLHLKIFTHLPWRNMYNLTSLTLAFIISQPIAFLGQMLDFFENAPRLSEVTLTSAIPTFDAQDGRLVSLSHLRRLKICGPQPPSILLDHLIIPVGAEAVVSLDSARDSQADDLLPRSLDNLQNLCNFSGIFLRFDRSTTCIDLHGPNGQFSVASRRGPDPTHMVIRALERFDTSNTQSLVIDDNGGMTNEIHQAMLSMENLHTLIISRGNDSPSFFLGLDLALASDGVVACSKLKELTYRVPGEFGLGSLVEFAAARASRAVPLKLVNVVGLWEPFTTDEVAELREHVSHVVEEREYNDQDEGSNEDEDSDESEGSGEDEGSYGEGWRARFW